MTKTTRKIISTATVFCFVMTQNLFASPGMGIEIASPREAPSFLQIDIPAELATLDGLYEAPFKTDPKMILHIQNAHANYGAQQKIKELLQYLEKTYAIKTIFVEGASEDLDPDYLKMFPDRERNLKLADYLAKQGELTGAELYLLEADKDHGPETTDERPKTIDSKTAGLKVSPSSQVSGLKSDGGAVKAHGIEDAALYRENYEALKKVFGAEATVNRYLEGFEGRMGTLASKVFSKDLFRFLGDWKKFEKGHREFMPYVRTLTGASKQILGIDFESLLAQIEWPQITRLLVLQTMEKELDMQKGIAERDQLIAFLKGKQVSASLITAIENFRDQRVSMLRAVNGGAAGPIQPRDLMEQLVKEAGPKGFYFHNYPNFSLYAGYLILKNELDPKGLFAEIQVLFKRLLDQLAQTPREKQLLELYRNEELVRKLLNLELTRKDWQEVLARKDLLAMDSLVAELKEIGTAVSRETGLPLTNFETKPVNPKFRGEVTEAQEAAYGFYDAARRRESVFYEKITSVMAKDSLNKAVVITGGFHTDGMTDLFREHEVSYGVLTPRLMEKSDEKMYRAVMLQNKASLFELSYLEAALRLLPPGAYEAQVGEIELQESLHTILGAIRNVGDFGDLTDAIKIFNNSIYAKVAGIQVTENPLTDADGKPRYQDGKLVYGLFRTAKPATGISAPVISEAAKQTATSDAGKILATTPQIKDALENIAGPALPETGGEAVDEARKLAKQFAQVAATTGEVTQAGEVKAPDAAQAEAEIQKVVSESATKTGIPEAELAATVAETLAATEAAEGKLDSGVENGAGLGTRDSRFENQKQGLGTSATEASADKSTLGDQDASRLTRPERRDEAGRSEMRPSAEGPVLAGTDDYLLTAQEPNGLLPKVIGATRSIVNPAYHEIKTKLTGLNGREFLGYRLKFSDIAPLNNQFKIQITDGPKEVGYLVGFISKNESLFQVQKAKINREYRYQGIMPKFYVELFKILIANFGVERFSSDYTVIWNPETDGYDAVAMWESLVKRGMAVRQSGDEKEYATPQKNRKPKQIQIGGYELLRPSFDEQPSSAMGHASEAAASTDQQIVMSADQTRSEEREAGTVEMTRKASLEELKRINPNVSDNVLKEVGDISITLSGAIPSEDIELLRNTVEAIGPKDKAEEFEEDMGLIFGEVQEGNYTVTRIVPITRFFSRESDYFIPDADNFLSLIEQYTDAHTRFLGDYHTHPGRRLLWGQVPGGSTADRTNTVDDLLSTEQRSQPQIADRLDKVRGRIAERLLGIVFEPAIDTSLPMSQIDLAKPADINIFTFVPDHSAETGIINVSRESWSGVSARLNESRRSEMRGSGDVSAVSAGDGDRASEYLFPAITLQENPRHTMPSTRSEALKLQWEALTGGKKAREEIQRDLRQENNVLQANAMREFKLDPAAAESINKLKAWAGDSSKENEFMEEVGKLARQYPYASFQVTSTNYEAVKGLPNVSQAGYVHGGLLEEMGKNLYQYGGFGVVISGLPLSGRTGLVNFSISRNPMGSVDPTKNANRYRANSDGGNQHNFLKLMADSGPALIASGEKFFADTHTNRYGEGSPNDTQKNLYDKLVKKEEVPAPEPGRNPTQQQNDLVERNTVVSSAQERLVNGTFMMFVNPDAVYPVGTKEMVEKGDYRAAAKTLGDVRGSYFFNDLRNYDKVKNEVRQGNAEAFIFLLEVEGKSIAKGDPVQIDEAVKKDLAAFIETVDLSIFEKTMADYASDNAIWRMRLRNDPKAIELYAKWEAGGKQEVNKAIQEANGFLNDVRTETNTRLSDEHQYLRGLLFGGRELTIQNLEERYGKGKNKDVKVTTPALLKAYSDILALRMKYAYLRSGEAASLAAASSARSEVRGDVLDAVNQQVLDLASRRMAMREPGAGSMTEDQKNAYLRAHYADLIAFYVMSALGQVAVGRQMIKDAPNAQTRQYYEGEQAKYEASLISGATRVAGRSALNETDYLFRPTTRQGENFREASFFDVKDMELIEGATAEQDAILVTKLNGEMWKVMRGRDNEGGAVVRFELIRQAAARSEVREGEGVFEVEDLQTILAGLETAREAFSMVTNKNEFLKNKNNDPRRPDFWYGLFKGRTLTAEEKELIAGTVTAAEDRLQGMTLTAEVIEEEFYGGLILEFGKLMPGKTVPRSKTLTMSRRRFLRIAFTVAATGAVVWGLGEAGRFLSSWLSGLNSREDEALNGDLDALRKDALKITNTDQKNYMAHYIDALRAARESEEALYPGISAEEKAQRVLYMATRAVAFVLSENPDMRDNQVGGGPAVGHFQAEPQTIADTIRMVNNAREGSRLYPAKRLLEKGMWKESAVYDLIRSAVGPSGNTIPGKPVDAATIGGIINSTDIKSREAAQFLIFRLMSFTKNMEPSAEEVKGGLMQNLGNEVESYLAGYNTAFSSETMMPRNEGEEDASMEVGLSISPKITAAYLHAEWLVNGAWLKGGNGTLEDILSDKNRDAFEAAYRKVESDLYYVSNVDTRLVQALRVIRFAERRADEVQNLNSRALEGWRSIITIHRQRLNELVGKNAQGNMDESVRKAGKDVLVQAGKALEALKARSAEGFGEEAWGIIQTAAQDQYGHEVRAQRRILRKLDRVAGRLPKVKKESRSAAGRSEARAMVPVSGMLTPKMADAVMTAAIAATAQRMRQADRRSEVRENPIAEKINDEIIGVGLERYREEYPGSEGIPGAEAYKYLAFEIVPMTAFTGWAQGRFQSDPDSKNVAVDVFNQAVQSTMAGAKNGLLELSPGRNELNTSDFFILPRVGKMGEVGLAHFYDVIDIKLVAGASVAEDALLITKIDPVYGREVWKVWWQDVDGKPEAQYEMVPSARSEVRSRSGDTSMPAGGTRLGFRKFAMGVLTVATLVSGMQSDINRPLAAGTLSPKDYSLMDRAAEFLNRLFGRGEEGSQDAGEELDPEKMSSEQWIKLGKENYMQVTGYLDEVGKRPDAADIVKESITYDENQFSNALDEVMGQMDKIMTNKNLQPLVPWLFEQQHFQWNIDELMDKYLNDENIGSEFAYQYMLSDPQGAMMRIGNSSEEETDWAGDQVRRDRLFKKKLEGKSTRITKRFLEIAALPVNSTTKQRVVALLPLIAGNQMSVSEALKISGRVEEFSSEAEGGDKEKYIHFLNELDQAGSDFARQAVKEALINEFTYKREEWNRLYVNDRAQFDEDVSRYSAEELFKALNIGSFMNGSESDIEAFNKVYETFIQKAKAAKTPMAALISNSKSDNNTFLRSIIDESIYGIKNHVDRFVNDIPLEDHLNILEVFPQPDFNMQMAKMHYINALSRRYPNNKDIENKAKQQEAVIKKSMAGIIISQGEQGIQYMLRASAGFPGTNTMIGKLAEPVLTEMSEKNPDDKFFNIAPSFYGQPYGPGILLTAAKQNPSGFVTSNFSSNFLSQLEKSASPEIRALMEIRRSAAYSEANGIMALLLDDIVAGSMTLEEAHRVAQKPFVLKHAVEQIQSRPGHLGEYSIAPYLQDVNTSNWSLGVVLSINNADHNNPVARFAPLEGATAKEMYDLVTYGQQEIQTSTFNGIFDRLMPRMASENMDGQQLIDQAGHDFRTFVSLMAQYNRLNDFFTRCSLPQQEAILNRFASNLEKEDGSLTEATIVADAFGMIQDPVLFEKIQALIKKEYLRVEAEGNKEAKILYGLLAGMSGNSKLNKDPWFKNKKDEYQISNPMVISGKSLFNEQGINVQRYYFYKNTTPGDNDSQLSFENLVSTYARDPANWGMEEHENFIKIYSKTGENIEIFANRPTDEGETSGEIEKIFGERKVQPQVVVHRGHSTYAGQTLNKIKPGVVLVGLGSCGGAGNTSAILDISPAAHIIATKGTGSKFVNDPMLFIINETIRTGGKGDLNWKTTWDGKIVPRLGNVNNFSDYIAPYKNDIANFIRAYQRRVAQEGGQATSQTQASEVNGARARSADSLSWITFGNPGTATAYAYPLADSYASFLAEGEAEPAAVLQSAPVDSTTVEPIGTPDLAQPEAQGASQTMAALDEFLDNAARTGKTVPLPYGLLAAVTPERSAGVSDAYSAPESVESRVALAAAQELKLSENALTASEWPRKSGGYPCYVVRDQGSRKMLAIVFVTDARQSKATIYTATQNGAVFYDLIDQYAAQFPEKSPKESAKARKTASKQQQISYDVPQLQEAAATGDLKAAETLLELAQKGDPAARAALQTLDPARLVNSLTYRRGLEELAVLIGLVDAGNAAALNALKTLDITGIKKGKALVGDPNVRVILGVLAGYGNPVEQEDYTYRQGDLFNKAGGIPKFAEAVFQNPLSSRQQFDVLTFLFLSGSPAASKALRTINVDKIIRSASGDKRLQDLLENLAAMGNPGAQQYVAGSAATGTSSESPARMTDASLKASSVSQLIDLVAAGQHPEAHEELLNRIVLAVEESALQGIRKADVTALSKAAVDQVSAPAWSTLMALAMKGHPAAAQALTGVKDGLRENIRNGVNLKASVRMLANIHEADYYTTFQIQQQPTSATDRDVLKTLRAIWGNPDTVPYRNSVSRYFDNTDYPVIIESLEEKVKMSDMVHLLFLNELGSAGSIRFMRDPDHMISLIDEYESILPRAEKLNIEHTGRFTLDQLKEIIVNRENNRPDGRQLVIALYATEDWNAAFATDQLKEYSADKFRVMYYETGMRNSIKTALQEAGGKDGASIITFNFHGSPTGMSLGEDELEIKNEKEFADAGAAKALKPGGTIVLNSCSNGEGKEQANNIANMMRRLFPQAKYKGIYSLTGVGALSVEFDNNGTIIRVVSNGPEVYQAMIDLINQGVFANPSDLAKPEAPSDRTLLASASGIGGATLAAVTPQAAEAAGRRSEAREVRQEDLTKALSQETLQSAGSIRLGPDRGMIERAEEQGASAEAIVALVSGGFVAAGAELETIAALVTGFVSLTVKTLETIVRERIAPSRQDSVLPMGDLPGLVVDVETAMPSVAKWDAIEAILTFNKNQHYGVVFLAAADQTFQDKVSSLRSEVRTRFHYKNLDAASPSHVLQNSVQKMFAEVQKGGQARAYRSVGQAFVITAAPELCDKLGEGLPAAVVEIPAAIDREVLDTAGTAMAAAFSQELLGGDKLSEKTSQAIKQTGRRYQFNAEGLKALLTKITAEIQGLLSIRASA